MTVLVASSGKETNLGLSGMEQLPEGIGGMLFEFEGGQTATFHMENTLIPLDLWWFNSEGLVIGFTEMDPCLVDPCVQYRSPGIVTWALETPQGVFDFRPGDRLTNVENE